MQQQSSTGKAMLCQSACQFPHNDSFGFIHCPRCCSAFTSQLMNSPKDGLDLLITSRIVRYHFIYPSIYHKSHPQIGFVCRCAISFFIKLLIRCLIK
jgi:hypothetical protein